MSGAAAKLLGRWGEYLVAEDLKRKGCKILARGWRCRMGEIDIIASDGTFLRFVEVKLRKNAAFSAAREAVDTRKQGKLRVTAQLYLSCRPSPLQPRFDVAEVYAPQGTATEQPEITYIEDAF